MASIEKRGDGYRFIVSVGIGKDKKQVKKTMTYYPKETAPTKIEKELQREAAKFEELVVSGKYLDGEKIKFSDFVTLWETDYARDNLNEEVLENHKRRLETIFIPKLGHMKLAKITHGHIQAIVDSETKRCITGTRGKNKNKTVSVSTVKKEINILSGVFNRAVKMGLIAENPCRNIDYPKKELDFRLHTFSVDQARVFISILSNGYTVTKRSHQRTIKKTGKVYSVADYREHHVIPLQFQCLYLILIHCGLRRGEALALQWADVDFDNCELNINKSTTTIKGKQTIKEPKTRAGYRKVAITNGICDLLKKWETEQMELALGLGNLWNGYTGKEFDRNFIFIQPDTGKQMHLSTVTHKFREILEFHNANCKEDEKLPIIRLHDLRHTSATLLISNGIDVRSTAARLGHASPSVTLNFYAEALESVDHVASDKLGEVLSI